ncbi:hypothetical protein [Salinicola sp. RZ23]|uniref:hypothetical protein n=1 Tax=Salinicola sp. RZ23 TaxID=1949087 RepID=UPI000DA20D03|nr:hypothetical protein [Salinicola sp. RZ23]
MKISGRIKALIIMAVAIYVVAHVVRVMVMMLARPAMLRLPAREARPRPAMLRLPAREARPRLTSAERKALKSCSRC